MSASVKVLVPFSHCLWIVQLRSAVNACLEKVIFLATIPTSGSGRLPNPCETTSRVVECSRHRYLIKVSGFKFKSSGRILSSNNIRQNTACSVVKSTANCYSKLVGLLSGL